MSDWAAQKHSFYKSLHPKMTHCCEVLKPCFLSTFVKHKYLEVLLEISGAFKSKYIHKPPMILKYGAFYIKNEVSVPLQSLLVQLSWQVIPPLETCIDQENLWTIFFISLDHFLGAKRIFYSLSSRKVWVQSETLYLI